MIDQLSNNAVMLAQNAYGNYALQVAMDNWDVSECKAISNRLQPELLKLSQLKFSSNVIEKIIDMDDQETIIAYALELNHLECIKILLRNTFGFYVVERILTYCKDQGVVASFCNNIQVGL